MGQIGIGVIGCGYWGPNLVRNFNALPDAEIVVLCDATKARAQETQLMAPRSTITTEFDAVLGDPRVDAVVVATPAQTHFGLTLAALESGHHVFVEKPVAMTSEEAEVLVALAQERGLVLMTGHTFLYSPPVRKIRELLTSGAIGQVLTIDSSRVNLGIFRSDVDVLWDLGPHDISIIMYLLGKLPQSVACGGASYMRENIHDAAYLHLRFAGGQMAHVFLSWLSPVKLRRMTIVGREGMILYDDTAEMEKVKVYTGDSHSLTPEELRYSPEQLYRIGDVHIPALPRLEPLRAQCEEFLECVRTGAEPASSGVIGAQVVRLLEGAHRSLELEGRQVPLAWREDTK